MANHRKIPADIDLAERAEFFGVSERTVRRWHEQGADLRDIESVADLLLRQHAPSPAAMAAINTNLQ